MLAMDEKAGKSISIFITMWSRTVAGSAWWPICGADKQTGDKEEKASWRVSDWVSPREGPVEIRTMRASLESLDVGILARNADMAAGQRNI